MDLKLASSLEELEKLFSSRMGDYEEKLQKATSEAPAHADLATLTREFIEFKNFAWHALTKIKNQIELLTLGLDNHETTMRRKVLLFHGIPEVPNEKLHESIMQIITADMKLLDVQIQHINICHRLGGSQEKARPILVRFHRIEHRHIVWDNKTVLKGSGITISEFLTKMRHRVFTTARRHFGIRICWSMDGKIIILTPDKNRRKVVCKAELDALISQYPSPATMAHDSQASQSELAPKNLTSKNTAKTVKTRRRRD